MAEDVWLEGDQSEDDSEEIWDAVDGVRGNCVTIVTWSQSVAAVRPAAERNALFTGPRPRASSPTFM